MSVDIENSLQFKNDNNLMRLYDIYEDSRKALEELWKKGRLQSGILLDSPKTWMGDILTAYSREEYDWAKILEARLNDFHRKFIDQLTENEIPNARELAERSLWKLQGDELVYTFRSAKRLEMYRYVISFLSAIRLFDKDDVSDFRFPRLKGTAWVAGFPIRNREITVPGLQLYRQESGETYEKHDFPKSDFLGPDIDTGFRLTKHSHPGLLTVSLELADLLGQLEKTPQVRGLIVGWEILKGVWEGRPYPIIWAVLPKHLDSDYDEFLPWSGKTSKLAATWIKRKLNGTLEDLDQLACNINKTRERLPRRLGVVKPYIPEEEAAYKIDEKHDIIYDLLSVLPQKDEAETSPKGDMENPAPYASTTVALLKALFSKALPDD